MQWAENLYMSRCLTSKKEQIISKTEEGKTVPNVFFITLSSNPDNLLDIYNSVFLGEKDKGFYPENPFVVGIAESCDEAQELLLDIVDDVLEKTGGLDMRKYFGAPG